MQPQVGTTLSGEGLQHADGNSHIQAALIPNCLCYDPAFGYELAVIVQDGIKKMMQEGKDVFYYITVTNENHVQLPMPEGTQEGIVKGMYKFSTSAIDSDLEVQLLASGPMLQESIKAVSILEDDFGVTVNLYSVTSYAQLARDAQTVERCNRNNLSDKVPYITEVLANESGPVIAVSDYARSLVEPLARHIPNSMSVLGTDGFGLSDTRAMMREHFEVNSAYIAYSCLYELYKQGSVSKDILIQAQSQLSIDTKRQFAMQGA